ncbi:MAG: DUF362 domain-containing protein [Deltaproteobacteria bacterium]|nr:DUF362 domain-containing protein [Deltaproteobacteria bacterium]
MKEGVPITRRESIKRIARISGGIAVAGPGLWSRARPALGGRDSGRFIVLGKGETPGYSVKDLTRKVFEASGGIQRFVSKGDVVAIKPNISWARRPQFAATTHPEVLEVVIELCKEAGAKKVRIVDNTIHDARRCFALSGAGQVAKKTGAELVFPRSSLMRRMKLQGSRLDVWPVMVPLVEADKLINLPVAKHHSLSSLTLGMKNWIGGVGGSRWALHQDVHQCIVDLTGFFKPTITLIDAIRVLERNGPSGGSLEDVSSRDTVILSDDPVAADAMAATLFGRDPGRISFIKLADKWGLGTSKFAELDGKKVVL